MFKLYNKYILPKLLDSGMKKKEIQKNRPEVVGLVSGIVLEVGFGSGLNLPYYKNVDKIYALEPSQKLYDLSKERVRDSKIPVEHLKVSAEKIPLPDNSVDFVLSTWTLCSIPKPEIALREISRVLKTQGKFVFIEHGKSPKNFILRIQKIITPISKNFTGGCHLDRDMEKLISENGFIIEKLEKFQENFYTLVFLYKGIATPKL